MEDKQPQSVSQARRQPEFRDRPKLNDAIPHKLLTKAAYALLKRVVALELAQAEESCPLAVRLVVELDMGAPLEDTPRTSHRECLSPAEELASLSGGVSALLRRCAKDGEDFRVLTVEQQEWLEKLPLDKSA